MASHPILLDVGRGFKGHHGTLNDPDAYRAYRKALDDAKERHPAGSQELKAAQQRINHHDWSRGKPTSNATSPRYDDRYYQEGKADNSPPVSRGTILALGRKAWSELSSQERSDLKKVLPERAIRIWEDRDVMPWGVEGYLKGDSDRSRRRPAASRRSRGGRLG